MRLFVHRVDVKRNVPEALEPGLIIDFEIFVQTKTVSNRDDGRKKDDVCKYLVYRVALGVNVCMLQTKVVWSSKWKVMMTILWKRWIGRRKRVT